MPMVQGFLPSTLGLHFNNSDFPHLALLSIPTPFGDIDIGDSAMGVCGGMVFTVRDYFEVGFVPPLTNQPPQTETDPFYVYLVPRFFASFGFSYPIPTPIPALASNLPTHYYGLMDPALPDHETVASKAGLAPHGRAWVMIEEEWPKIQKDIDAGKLSPIGLVLVKSLDPTALGDNHVVLVYGYDLNGTNLVLHVYDPNKPDRDDVTLSLNIADPEHTTPITYEPDPTINCFFHLGYSPVVPPQNAACTSQNMASLLQPGQNFSATVTMKNIGLTTWMTGGNTPYRLGSQNPQDNATWGFNRVDLPTAASPGASVTFNFTVTAPAQLGGYNFEWRMVNEAVEWFGDFTPNVLVSVGAAVEVPNLVGQSPNDASSIAQQAGLWMQVTQVVPGSPEGDSVVAQTPAAHSHVPPHTTIRVTVAHYKGIIP
ncbi:MAG: hypothetical protein NVSMB49_22440 [Ktedonobacteraceae bacterium]